MYGGVGKMRTMQRDEKRLFHRYIVFLLRCKKKVAQEDEKKRHGEIFEVTNFHR